MRGMVYKRWAIQRAHLDDGTPIDVYWEQNKAEPENPESWNITHIEVRLDKWCFGFPCQLGVVEWCSELEAALRKKRGPVTEEDPLVQRA